MGSIFIFISILIISSIIWGNRTFSVKTLNQIIFHLKVPMEGTDDGIYLDWFIWSVPVSIIIVILQDLVIFNFHRIFKEWSKVSLFFRRHFIKYGIFCIVISLIFTVYNYDIYGYLNNMSQETDLYENYYVDPSKVNINFEKKRNIIHLYLESVENTYSNTQFGGVERNNYIKELGILAKNNINFSHNDNIGGSMTIDGTQWTIASQVSQNMGIPLSLPINAKNYDKNTKFLPGGYSLGEVLEFNGYINEFMCGSDANFGGTSNFYKQHGNYIIRDYNSFKENNEISDDYFVFWGIEDTKLFEFAKSDIIKLASGDKPFNMEITTIDTHTPDGYLCDKCKKNYKNQYANVIECQSKQINDFINWCKEQEWYDNTTIVVTGDHNSMSEKFFKNIDKNYIRTPYNCIINSIVEPVNNKNRLFSTIDMYPTILAAMGAKVDGDRLGLGTNLFSNKKTLMEEIGFSTLNNEVQKTSKFYNNKIVGLKE
ncbi:LTA synthase family protein [Thomasclavelia cocleata]|uniref:LTA synthase family protein n=1 Tax=Thomasclavelia cocleata TaxID=69824 RepID=UPI00257833EC|nr:LTA synthase family protein [Thomasclavelia cocleata]